MGLQCHCLFPWMATGGAGAKAEEPGSVRIALWAVIPGPPVQEHCSMLTVADGDDSQSNKSWLHTHTPFGNSLPSWEYYLWKHGLQCCLLTSAMLRQASYRDSLWSCHHAEVKTIPRCGWVRETNVLGREYRVGKITGGLHLSILLLPVATITGFPPHLPCCT